jgi:YggT family protein
VARSAGVRASLVVSALRLYSDKVGSVARPARLIRSPASQRKDHAPMSDVAGIIQTLLTLLSFAIIGRALMSWFDPRMQTAVGRVLFQITEPIIAPIRRVVPSLGMIDISPFIALILIQILSRMIVSSM